jgi:hypothetical protein
MKKNITKKTVIDQSIAISIVTLAFTLSAKVGAYPMDPAKLKPRIDLPNEVSNFTLAHDSFDPKLIYVQPKTGVLATVNGLPMISLAKYKTGSTLRGILNMQYDLSIQGREKEILYNALKAKGYTPSPLPISSVAVVPLLPGWDREHNSNLCGETIDEATGEKEVVCDSLVEKVRYTEKGPGLGENVAMSVILSSIGAQTVDRLLSGGNAFPIEVNAKYFAAAPAYTAKIKVNYEKLAESFASFAAYHDGRCIDVQVSAFWQKEELCKDKDPSQCSVLMTITDNTGKEVSNIFTDPESKNSENIKNFHESVELLRKKFEDEMLVKEAIASVDKSINSVFTLRADYRKVTKNIHFEVERKSLGEVIEKQTTIPASVMCVGFSPNGAPIKNDEGMCNDYWRNLLPSKDIISAGATGI